MHKLKQGWFVKKPLASSPRKSLKEVFVLQLLKQEQRGTTDKYQGSVNLPVEPMPQKQRTSSEGNIESTPLSLPASIFVLVRHATWRITLKIKQFVRVHCLGAKWLNHRAVSWIFMHVFAASSQQNFCLCPRPLPVLALECRTAYNLLRNSIEAGCKIRDESTGS
jgi:hypothetical protein